MWGEDKYRNRDAGYMIQDTGLKNPCESVSLSVIFRVYAFQA